MSKRKAYAKAKRESGGFIALPHAVLRSEKYGNLSAIATKLINDLFAQFNGKNNGDLCCAWTILNKRGWVSRDTLNRARIELLEKQFIEVSRQGGRNTPTLYALTFYSVDDCGGKLDIQPTGSPKGLWRLPPIEVSKRKRKKNVNTIIGSINPELARLSGQL